MRFKLFLEAEDFGAVEDALKRVSKAYARGGNESLHRAMERYFTAEVRKQFGLWWKKYYSDYDDHGITIGGTKFYTEDPNPNLDYLFAKIAKSESVVKGRYKPVEDYIRQGWTMYAQRGDEALGEWMGSLPEGFFAKLRRWGFRFLKDSGIHYQLAEFVKNYSRTPQTDPTPLKVGDYLHRKRLIDNWGSSYNTRDTFAGYPDLQDAWDRHLQRREEERRSRVRNS